MEFYIILIFYETALLLATRRKNIELVKVLLSCDKIDINYQNIL